MYPTGVNSVSKCTCTCTCTYSTLQARQSPITINGVIRYVIVSKHHLGLIESKHRRGTVRSHTSRRTRSVISRMRARWDRCADQIRLRPETATTTTTTPFFGIVLTQNKVRPWTEFNLERSKPAVHLRFTCSQVLLNFTGNSISPAALTYMYLIHVVQG